MQHSACMIEAFKRDGPVYHVVKKCRNDCPVLINSTAQHIRCCFKDACNDLITIGKVSADLISLFLLYFVRLYIIIIIIIIYEFHRDASLEQNFRAAICHVLHSCQCYRGL